MKILATDLRELQQTSQEDVTGDFPKGEIIIHKLHQSPDYISVDQIDGGFHRHVTFLVTIDDTNVDTITLAKFTAYQSITTTLPHGGGVKVQVLDEDWLDKVREIAFKRIEAFCSSIV
jgi:hypothetical protein